MGQVALAVGIGNFMEWYDFAVYGFFAVVIGQLFFVGEDPVVALLSSLGVFAVGFFFRPLGGLILGPIGDRYGRRVALSISVLAMGIATLLIGLLPTYSQIGIWAPILLILMRCLQGLSAGGEWTGSAAFLIEGAPADKRARYGSVISATAALATLFGSMFALFLNSVLTPEQFETFGWRIPFLLAAPLAMVGLIIRLRLDETPVFNELRAQAKVAKSPLSHGAKRNLKAILLTIAFAAVQGLGYYYLATYVVNHLQVTLELPRREALYFAGTGLAMYMFMCPIAGWLSDKFGRRRLNIIGTFGYVVLPVPVFSMIGAGSPALTIFGLFLLGATQCLVSVTTVVMLVELFPASTRASSSAIGFNIALAFIGGPGPYIATWLTTIFATSIAPAFYQVTVALIAFFAVIRWLPESTGNDLSAEFVDWGRRRVSETPSVAVS